MPITEILDLTAPHRRGRRHLYRQRQLWSLRPGRPPLPLELVSTKCKVLVTIGSYEAAVALLASMVPKAEAMGDKRWAASMAADLAYALSVLGEAGAALPHAERSRSLYLELGDEPGLARSLYVLAQVCNGLDMNRRARELTRELLKLAEQTGQDSLSVRTIFSLRFELGTDQALQRLQGYLDKARGSGDKDMIALCLFYMGDIYMNNGLWAAAEACNSEQYRLAAEIGNRMGMSFAIGDRGLILHGQGRYREAIECYLKKLEIAESMGDFYNVFEALGNAGVAYQEMGELSSALEYFSRAEAHTRRHQVQHFLAKSLYLKAKCLLGLGDFRRSALSLAEALEIARDIEDRYLVVQGSLLEARLEAREDPERAAAKLEALLENTEDDEVRAEVYSELFRLSGLPEHKARALEHYRKYYEQSKRFYVSRRIAELEGR